MKANELKSYQVYEYGKAIIIANNATEMAFNKDIQQELKILGGSLNKGIKIEQFLKANDDHKIAWLKDTSLRKTPEKTVFWAFIFPGYKKAAIEKWIKALKNPKFRIENINEVTTEAEKSIKELQSKYKKPSNKAKTATKQPSESAKVKALNKQIAEMQAQMAAFQDMMKTAKK